ncbi:MAG: MBL fold metallo-hydrolase [Spirochaetales bacterium]|nr:MBL fold metallo-hydrolase [Spirochaetales bacterium]
MTIQIVSNNYAMAGFEEEHGFALLIKENNEITLFDTGRGRAFINNIERMKIDIFSIQNLILSHGHYDHCGNIDYIFNKNNKIKIYTHPAFSAERYSIHQNRDPKLTYIGISSTIREQLSKYQLINTEQPTQISANMFVTGEIPRESSEDTGGPFFFDKEGEKVDKIIDDEAIYITTPKGLIIITGCCHSGIINTVEHIKNISKESNIRAIIGGLHLVNASDERINQTINYLNSLNLEYLYPGHCTGELATFKLEESLNCKVSQLLVNHILTF